MEWRGRRQSGNVEDRRRMSGGGMAAGGGVVGVVFLVIYLLMGGDPAVVIQQQQQRQNAPQQQGPASKAEEELRQFVGVVLADTEDVWGELFQQEFGQRYPEPKLVLFTGHVQSACGSASSAVGPFYCPGDQNVYLDLSFFDELRSRFGAPGDFAAAYVIAHEVGHHIQNQLGLTDRVHGARRSQSETEANRMSVRLELQADYLAGVWAHHAQRMKQILEEGDIEEALRAASAIGDDRLQKQARGTVVPDSFTHGSSAQRVKWFRRGLETGNLEDMNELFELPYERL